MAEKDCYRAQRVVVKRAVKVAKRMADWRWGERLLNNFDCNKKMFWKEVKRVKKGDSVRVRWRWAEYFEQVLNVREANINVVGNWLTPMFGDLNGRATSLVEVTEAVNEMKSGKGSTAGCIYSRMFKERWYGSIRMVS